ncbi:MAG TPA: M28 family peptidase [Myxococcales bacterium]
MRRASFGLVPALSLVLAGLGARADQGNAAPHLDGEVNGLVNRIDPARIQDRIEHLATFGTRNACSTPDNNPNLKPTQGILASQQFVFDQFSAIKGLHVAAVSSDSAAQQAHFLHGNCPTSPTQNVVAWLPGKTHPERLVVIGGHLDSRSFGVLDVNPDTSQLLASVGATAPVLENAPAGDDAGAQSTLVLEAAAALARSQFDNTIVFIVFSGEEQGLFGSADTAQNAGAAIAAPSRLEGITGIKGAKVVAMLNNDISGGDNLANTGDDFSAFRLYAAGTPREQSTRAEDGTADSTSPARGLMRFIATFGVPLVDGFNMRTFLREDRPGRGSDQTSYLNNQVPAVRFIESHECSSSPVDNSCPATIIPADPNNSALTNGRPCPSPFAALPRTDLRHNCLHTNFVVRGTVDGVDVSTKVCKNDDERAHGVVIQPTTVTSQNDPLFVLNKTLFEGCIDDTAANPFHNFQRQHAPNDRPENPTADYEARIAKVMTATLAHLARAPNAPVNFAASGNANDGVNVTFNAAPGDKAEKFIVAARPVTANFHTGRVRVDGSGAFVTPQQLGIAPGQAFFISVSAIGNGNHESLFAYPEFRCDATGCTVPAGALNITATK